MSPEELLCKALDLLLDIQWAMSDPDPTKEETDQMIEEIQDYLGYE